MHRNGNVIGQNVAKYRYLRGWTQDQLVAKLQSLGCYMTRDILANIETKRCVATDKQIEYLAEVLEVQISQLFPEKRHFSGRVVGLEIPIITRRRSCHQHRCQEHPRPRPRLAQHAKR